MTIQRFSVLCGLILIFGHPSMAEQRAGKGAPARKSVPLTPARALAEIGDSHVQDNVPPKTRFDQYLRRDLTVYFTRSTGRKVAVGYEFLRNGPTQTGIAFPKYYLWVQIRAGKKLVGEGAVRVAAIDRKRFEVTHYLPEAEMRKDPDQIDSVFPLPVGKRIRQKLK